MQCIICGKSGARNWLGVRCRRPARVPGVGPHNVWGPDSDAYLCKAHADAGIELLVSVVPTTTGQVKVTYDTTAVGGTSVSRTTAIQKAAATP